jgi:hypothetical protein
MPGVAGVALSLLPLGASAHHSFAMFDADHMVTMSGTVKTLEWTNPHAWLYVVVQDPDGMAVEWSLEMQGTGQSTRTGWKPDSVKPGDKVTVEIRPMKSGARGGQLVTATLPDGRTLGARGAPNNPYGD